MVTSQLAQVRWREGGSTHAKGWWTHKETQQQSVIWECISSPSVSFLWSTDTCLCCVLPFLIMYLLYWIGLNIQLWLEVSLLCKLSFFNARFAFPLFPPPDLALPLLCLSFFKWVIKPQLTPPTLNMHSDSTQCVNYWCLLPHISHTCAHTNYLSVTHTLARFHFG